MDGSDPPVEYHRKGSAASHMGVADVDEALAALRAPPACHRRVCRHLRHQPAGRPQARMERDARRGPHHLVRPEPAPHAVAVARTMRHWINTWPPMPTGCCPGMEEGRLFLTGQKHPRVSPRFTASGAPSWWSSSLGPRCATTTAMRAPAACPASPWPRWSTPWARATVLRWASSAHCWKACRCPKQCAAARGLVRVPCRCWVIPKACPLQEAQLAAGWAL
jgi:hypothetical protein